MSPTKTAAPAPAQGRSIDAVAYGFVAAADVNDEYAGPNTDRDALLGYVKTGDWPAIENLVGALDRHSDRRFEALNALGYAAVIEDGWLDAWLAGAPNSVDAWCVQMNSMVKVAWEIRSSKQPQHVARDQWDGFFRLLRQIPPICDRLTSIAPGDPAPYVEMLIPARGLQWKHDQFRDLWSKVTTLVPNSALASVRAMTYWRPRWYGSMDLLNEFVGTEIAAAVPGSTKTQMRLDVLFTEMLPDNAAERAAFYRGDLVQSAINASLADLAAADPANVRLPYLRHWLAYMLFQSDRNYEAIEQFRAIGGYSGAQPWTLFAKPKPEFTSTRATAVVRWEDSGRRVS